jgi:hypothetical protein
MKRPVATALLTDSLISLTSPVWISSAFWWSCHCRVICGSSQLPSSAATTVTSSGFASHAARWLLQEDRRVAC